MLKYFICMSMKWIATKVLGSQLVSYTAATRHTLCVQGTRNSKFSGEARGGSKVWTNPFQPHKQYYIIPRYDIQLHIVTHYHTCIHAITWKELLCVRLHGYVPHFYLSHERLYCYLHTKHAGYHA